MFFEKYQKFGEHFKEHISGLMSDINREVYGQCYLEMINVVDNEKEEKDKLRPQILELLETRRLKEQIVMNTVGTFEVKFKDEDDNIVDATVNGFFIKLQGVTMLVTSGCFEPISGTFKLMNGTELKINCQKSNTLWMWELSFWGVTEHLDKIGDTGFQIYQNNEDIPVNEGDNLLIWNGNTQIQRKVKEITFF